jgi:hypothetical protein
MAKTFCGRKRKGYKSNNIAMKLGESKIIVDMNDFYYIRSAIEWEAKRQINKISKEHLTRVWINPIKRYEYSDDITGINLVFYTANSSYKYASRIHTQSMQENMNKAVQKIVNRESGLIDDEKYVKNLQKDFKTIIKNNFKKFKLKKNYDDDYVEGKLSNNLEVKIGRTFDKVELGYIPSNPINALRILEALDKVKFEKEIEEDKDDN